MRSYDIPRERAGILGTLAASAVPEVVKDNSAERRAQLRAMRNSFEALKAARSKILVAPGRKTAVTAALGLLKENKVPRLGKSWKAAVTELTCLLEEENPVVGKVEHYTAYLKDIRAAYLQAKEKLEAANSAIVDALSEEAKEVLKKYDKQATKLEFGKRDTMISRAPVIPISATPLDVSTAKRAGLSAENIGGYLLLNNQLVIGFRRLDKQKAKDAIHDMVKQLSKATNKKLLLVTDRSYPYKGNVWFWLADQATLNALRKAGRGNLQIRDWGFGFSSE